MFNVHVSVGKHFNTKFAERKEECNKIVEQNKKPTHPYELQFTKILFFTINFNLIVRCT